MNYKKYINSNDWHDKSNDFLSRHKYCKICRKLEATQVHHNTYKTLGKERDEDLDALCERCHLALHSMPPNIPDKVQLKKSMKIINYFNKYPKIRTLVINDISRKYYKNVFILDKLDSTSNGTAFFVQNLLEMLYEDGLRLNEDLIEATYASCIKYRIRASKNRIENEKDLKDRTKKYESGELQYVDIRYTTTKYIRTESEIIDDKMQRFCLNALSDKKILNSAKSHMNKKYYNGSVYFNKEGVITAVQFYLRMKNDGHHKSLFFELGGNFDELLEGEEIES